MLPGSFVNNNDIAIDSENASVLARDDLTNNKGWGQVGR